MSSKIYVDVDALFSKEGTLTPKAVIWEDGRSFKVDKVISCQRAASRKVGGVGLRFDCLIEGATRMLFYEENYKWFVEGK